MLTVCITSTCAATIQLYTIFNSRKETLFQRIQRDYNLLLDQKSSSRASMRSRLARPPLLPAAEGADGHLRADAAAARARLAHQEKAAGATETAGAGVPEGAGEPAETSKAW